MNPIQFNALAILFILGFMPFAVAFISSAGSSVEDSYISTIDGGYYAPIPGADSKWLYNGGVNATAEYDNTYPNALATTCIHIIDGWCRGHNDPGVYEVPTYLAISSPGIFKMNQPAVHMWQSHYYGVQGINNPTFYPSGADIFGWHFQSEYFPNLKNEESLDKMRFAFADTSTNYACNYVEFVNITFEAKIIFYKDGYELTFDRFEYESVNRYESRIYDGVNWHDYCYIGLSVPLDFTGYESMQLSSFIANDWNNVSVDLILTNFKREDGRNWADTPLPFAGVDEFRMTIEHQPVDSIQSGFIIRASTLILSGIVFLVAIASTEYWSPFKSWIGGALG